MRLAVVIAFGTLATCSSSAVERDAAPPARSSSPDRAVAAVGPSIYELSIQLTDAAGRKIGLDAQRGHPVLVSMFYGSCSMACPLLVDEIGRALAQLPVTKRDDVRVLLVSFDPARDTPARLSELVRVHHLDDRWTLASASDDDARALAAVLGIRYRAVAGGQFFHSSAVVALDRAGESIARVDGIGDPAALVAAVSE